MSSDAFGTSKLNTIGAYIDYAYVYILLPKKKKKNEHRKIVRPGKLQPSNHGKSLHFSFLNIANDTQQFYTSVCKRVDSLTPED